MPCSGNLRRAIDVVKLRETIGLVAARRESARAERRSSIVGRGGGRELGSDGEVGDGESFGVWR